MLKTQRQDQTLLVSQPDHARVAGYLAAHWGNEDFATPGRFADSQNPEELRAETVLAIAEHDNGWWEWEAAPEVGSLDSLPLDLAAVLKNQQAGMDRWRRGIPRLGGDHPYVSLLISFHAYWLYALRTKPDPDPSFIHPLFWNRPSESLYSGTREAESKFLADLEAQQVALTARLQADPATRLWVEPGNLKPHARLLQLLDGLSLALCSPLIPPSFGEAKGLGADPFDLLEVPRTNWRDRVTIEVRPAGDRQIVLHPYPFDLDPLHVVVPARIVNSSAQPSGSFQSWWHAQPLRVVDFELSGS